MRQHRHHFHRSITERTPQPTLWVPWNVRPGSSIGRRIMPPSTIYGDDGTSFYPLVAVYKYCMYRE
jgi:hypothetical protein